MQSKTAIRVPAARSLSGRFPEAIERERAPVLMGLPRALDELAMAVGDTCRVEKSVNLLSMLADQACVSPHWMSDQ